MKKIMEMLVYKHTQEIQVYKKFRDLWSRYSLLFLRTFVYTVRQTIWNEIVWRRWKVTKTMRSNEKYEWMIEKSPIHNLSEVWKLISECENRRGEFVEDFSRNKIGGETSKSLKNYGKYDVLSNFAFIGRKLCKFVIIKIFLG